MAETIQTFINLKSNIMYKQKNFAVTVKCSKAFDKHIYIIPREFVDLEWNQFIELVKSIKPYSKLYELIPHRTNIWTEKDDEKYPNGNETVFHRLDHFGRFILSIAGCKLHERITVTKSKSKTIAAEIPNYGSIKVEHSQYNDKNYTFFKGTIEPRLFKQLSKICSGISSSGYLYAEGLYDLTAYVFPQVYNLEQRYSEDTEEIIVIE